MKKVWFIFGGEFDMDRYKTFLADSDNVLPILDGAYFEDDIVSRFVEFVRVTFSEENLKKILILLQMLLGVRKQKRLEKQFAAIS